MWNQAIHGFIRLTWGGQFYLRGKAMQIAENKTAFEMVGPRDKQMAISTGMIREHRTH